MSNRQKWGYGAFGVGLVLAVIFFVVASGSDGGLRSAFLAAAMVCVVAGANGLAVGMTDRISAGRLTGLAVGAAGFVGWGIAWILDHGAPLGWAALFSAIAAAASMFPGVFGATTAQTS